MNQKKFYDRLILWLKRRNIPVRMILSVVAGVVTAKVLTVITHYVLYMAGKFPPPGEPMFDRDLLTITLIFHSVYTIFSAYITAWLAREKASKAVFILGTKEAVLWIAGIVLLWKHSPAWFNLTKAIIGIPLALFGGWLYKLYKIRKSHRRITPQLHR